MFYMKRDQIEKAMKAAHQEFISLVLNESDELGVLCQLKGGFLCDYTGHRVNKKMDIWGYSFYSQGVMQRAPLTEESLHEILFHK